MGEPPRDGEGRVIPYDDPDIGDDEGLIRHINPEHHVVYDKNSGEKRLSTGAFSESSKPPGGMSVDLEQRLLNDGKDSLAMLPDPGFGAVRLIAGHMRELQCQIGSDPLPNNPYHGEVWGIGKGRSTKMRIMDRMQWLRKPDSMS